LVLVNDDFGSILNAIRLGREIRENLGDAFRYLLSIHLPIVGISILPVLLKLPLILLPVHIAFLHLLIEPVSSIAFEAERHPVGMGRAKELSLFSGKALLDTFFRGARILAALLVVYVFAWYRGKGEWDTRGLTFTTLLFANFGLLLLPVVRHSKRKGLWLALGVGTLGGYFLLLQFPFMLELLKVNPLHPVDLLVCAVFGVVFSMSPVRGIFKFM